jgi:hypothetical protein
MKTPDEQRPAGASSPIIRVDEVGTALFVITAVLAAALFTNPVKVVAVVVCVALFTIGVFTFLLSFWAAVQRSRTDNISVTQLYFLSGEATPRAVKRVMNGALVVQSVVALATAIARNRTDGRAGSTLAFGILVPMFGLGLNGLWCARHGTFAPRPGPESDDPPESDAADVPPSDDEMEQNSRHG